jgi:hypothetical protein
MQHEPETLEQKQAAQKEKTPAQKIRHQLSVFQMMMLAGRDEAAIKCLKNLYQIADDLETA